MIKFNQELYNQCYEKASECSTCLEFSQRHGIEFYHSVRNWFIKKFTWLKDPDVFEWSEEAIYESCKKYKRFSAWKADNADIYESAKKIGILDNLPLNRSPRYNFLHSDVYRESLKYIDIEATEKLLGYKLEDADKKDIVVICKLINGERIEYNYDHLIRRIRNLRIDGERDTVSIVFCSDDEVLVRSSYADFLVAAKLHRGSISLIEYTVIGERGQFSLSLVHPQRGMAEVGINAYWFPVLHQGLAVEGDIAKCF